MNLRTSVPVFLLSIAALGFGLSAAPIPGWGRGDRERGGDS
jgi:hypothetical protein